MRLCVAFSLLTFCLIGYAVGQGYIIGKVEFLSSKNTPVEGIRIGSNGANPVYTKTFGEFTLFFPQKRVGEIVRLSIGDDDKIIDRFGNELELVSEVDIIPIPGIADEYPLRIVVCHKGFREQEAKKFYKLIKVKIDSAVWRVKSELDSALSQHERDFELISNLSRKIELLTKRYDSLAIYKDALYLASINKDGASSRIQEYLEKLESGVSPQEARESLSLEKACSEGTKSAKTFQSSIDELEILSRTSVWSQDYKVAIGCLDSLARMVSSTKFDQDRVGQYLYRSAILCNWHGWYYAALERLNHCLDILFQSKEKENKEKFAQVYEEMGRNYFELGWYDAAFDLQQKTHKARKSVQLWYPQRSATVNNYGVVYQKYGFLKLSRWYLKMAVKIDKHNGAEDETIINNLADVYFELEKYQLATQYYNKALEVMSSDSILNPLDSIRYYRITGKILTIEQKDREALDSYLKASRILEKGVSHYHSLDLAETYELIGATYFKLDNCMSSLHFLDHAMTIKENTLDSLNSQLGKAYFNIANVLFHNGYIDNSLRYQDLAITIFQKNLHHSLTVQRLYDSILTLNTRSLYQWSTQGYAAGYYHQALSLVEGAELKRVSDKLNYWNHVGLCTYKLNQFTKSISAFKEARHISKYNAYYNNIGLAYVKAGYLSRAKRAFTKYEMQTPDSWKPYRNWTIYYSIKGDNDLAIKNLSEAIKLGFEDSNWLKTDDSLEGLRMDNRFETILESLPTPLVSE